MYKIIKKVSATCLMLLISNHLFAQQKLTISGTIKDAQTGETLIGATLRVEQKTNIGVAANEYGFYSLSLPQGNYTLKASFVGYEEQKIAVKLDTAIVIDWKLENKKMLSEVVISSKRKGENLTKAVMGTETLNMKDIAKVPVIFGEKDILKTIQLLPGIKSAGEGNSGFYVRGGAADQNLILLDEAPVYNASHLLGFFSTFNSDAIKDATIIKGNSPSNYGGRLSSVLDVKMKEGNNKDYNVNGGIGLISSRLSVEGPIQKDKSSFIVSGRRTYADLFLKASPDFKDNKLYFYDLNAKANYKLNNKNHIFLSGYFGRDVLAFGNNFGIDWGNATGTLRWNSILNSKLFSNASLIYSNYDYNVKIKSGETNFNINSNIKDWNLKQDFSYYLNPKNSLRLGFNAIYHTITPSTFSGTVNNKESKEGRRSLENAVYVNNNFNVSEKLTLDYGLRLSVYTLLGGNTYNIYDKGIKTDSIVLSKGSLGKTYYNLEPRLTANYRLNDVSSLKAGYARNTQHLHLLSNSTSSNPTDQWIGNSYNIKPEIADQYSLGYSRNFNNNKYEFGAEVYYKNMQNQVDYKDAADINTAPDVESELLYGKGRAYGLELIVKKKEGKFTGWVSYTLSKTERLIEGINNNNWYNAKQDRTNDLSIVGIYQLSPRWSLSGVFVYNTGNAVTFPTGKYNLDGQTVWQYGDRNANRMPANHRLDLSATYEKAKKGRFESSWNFSLYNVYGRENAYTITFQDDPKNITKTQALQTSLFKWVPSVTYNFKF
ncbi:MAG: TonB-dependent receptor [Sphingobacteriales bacterium]|nr:MAG: TonB-dependent receptor [Sphingobacteriales bacterium]